MRVNVGDSAYFGSGRRDWKAGTVEAVHTSGGRRYYDVRLASGEVRRATSAIDVRATAAPGKGVRR